MLNVEKGVITAPTSAGQQTYNLPNGFAPKALILWTVATTSLDTVVANAIMCIGFGTFDGGTVQQGYNSWWDEDAAASAVCCRGKNTTAILKTFNADGPTVEMEIDLVSLNDGSPATFVLDYVDPPSTAVKIHYVALGGSDIAKARIGSFTVPIAATVDVTIAASWGQPDLLFFLGGGTQALGDGAGSAYMGLGVAASAMVRQSTSVMAANGGATQQNVSGQLARAYTQVNITLYDAELELSAEASWPTDGFQLSIPNQPAAANGVVIYLALQGTFQSALGANTAPTSGGLPVTQDNAAGFAPSLALVWGTNRAASDLISGIDAQLVAFWLGATDGTNEGGAAITNDDAVADMVSKRRHNETKTLQFFDPTAALASEADGSFSGDNFRLSWNDIDTVEREYNWLVLGGAEFMDAAEVYLKLTASGVEEGPEPEEKQTALMWRRRTVAR